MRLHKGSALIADYTATGKWGVDKIAVVKHAPAQCGRGGGLAEQCLKDL